MGIKAIKSQKRLLTANQLTPIASLSKSHITQKSTLLLFLLLNLGFLVGCRLKVPNVTEQQKLMEKGAFPSGPPPWVASVALGGARGRHLGSMVAPGFSASGFSGSGQAMVAQSTGSEEIQERIEQQKQKGAEQKPQQQTTSQSPLDAIVQLCPEVERDTAKALVIADTNIQIESYTKLVKRCPKSPDLWTWLGEAYYRTGLIVSAKKCFQQALFLDSSHPLSKKYLDQLTTSP